jgi:hypothetical protein
MTLSRDQKTVEIHSQARKPNQNSAGISTSVHRFGIRMQKYDMILDPSLVARDGWDAVKLSGLSQSGG